MVLINKKTVLKESEDFFSPLLPVVKTLKWPADFWLLKSETSIPNIFFIKFLSLDGPFKIFKISKIKITLLDMIEL